MIELEADPKRAAPPTDPDARANYLILGDFGGRPTKPVLASRDHLNLVFDRLEASFAGQRLHSLDDFHPDHLIQRLGALASSAAAGPEPAPPSPTPAPGASLDDILGKSSLLEKMTGDDPLKKYARELGQAYAEPAPAAAPDRTADAERMRSLLHDPRFQALEAAWRGLDFVLRSIDDESARIYIAQLSAQDLDNLLSAEDLTTTRVCALFHSNQWRGVAGLCSFGADHIELLGRIALLADSAGAPFVSEGSADMGPDWEELRAIPEAAHVGLALPRFLLRLPYGKQSSPIESFEFEELPGAPLDSEYLWGNPALLCLAVAAGPGRGSELDLHGLPAHAYEEDGEWRRRSCSKPIMNETEVYSLIDRGLMPIVTFRDTDRVRLAGLRAINGQPLGF